MDDRIDETTLKLLIVNQVVVLMSEVDWEVTNRCTSRFTTKDNRKFVIAVKEVTHE